MDTTTDNSSTSSGASVAPPAPTVWATLKANDALALIRFLVEVFGFEATAVYADGDHVAHAQLDWPEGGGIMLGSYTPAAAWTIQPGASGSYVVTDDVDGVHARAVAAGAEIVRAPTDTDYGSHEFTARDPEGNLWSFGTYRGEPRKPSDA